MALLQLHDGEEEAGLGAHQSDQGGVSELFPELAYAVQRGLKRRDGADSFALTPQKLPL